MKEKSWACTVITQLSLCVVGYIAVNIGQPQKFTTHGEDRINDMYFVSVAGGFRPLEEHSLLLQQMVKVEKIYKPRFVVEFSELGESDSLLQNRFASVRSGITVVVIRYFKSAGMYMAGALEGQGETYFLQKIKTPYGQTLDIIALDTVILQDQTSARANDQITWLTRTMNESNSDWKIVIGFHQLISSGYNNRKTKETPFECLHSILLQYGVDAYMSMKTSAGNIKGGATVLSDTGPIYKGPYLTAINQNLKSKEETVDGFLLHRINSLEMVTFVVKLIGEVEHRLSFQQKGRAAM